MRKLFERVGKKTSSELRRELAKTHLLVSLMAVVTILLISIGTTQLAVLDVRVAGVCVALLTVVVVMSLYTSLALFRKKA